MIIRGAKVYTGTHEFSEKDIYILGERIVEKDDYLRNAAGEIIIDGAGLYAIPGLVDIHFHGAAGHDFCEASLEGVGKIAAYEAENGITAICPAVMALEEERLELVMDSAAAYRAAEGDGSGNQGRGRRADLVGINLEGPFLSHEKAGAQNPQYLRKPDADLFFRLQEKSGNLIQLASVAPELDGAMEFIERCGGKAVISLAHTNADYDTAVRAFEKGARHVTHLYNAMQGVGHRKPGPIIAALERRATVELICDGIHVHPAMVRFTFRAFGADKVVLISDSMMACGLPDGEYGLGGQRVIVKGNRAALAEDRDTIAGSVTNLFDCMRTAVLEMGVPLEDAVRAATENPAGVIGAERDYGSLEPGHYADIVLMDDKLEIRRLIRRGIESAAAGRD